MTSPAEKGMVIALQNSGTAVGVADTHLQAIVEMEMFTSHIGYFPVIPGEK